MGFAKGWKAFRASQSTTKRAGRQRQRTQVIQVARRRKARRGGFRGFVRKNYSKRAGVSPEGLILPSMAYGAVRSKASDALRPISNMVPLGGVADEIVLGGLAYLGAKKLNNKMAKDFCRAALVVESARLGEAVLNGGVFGTSSGGSGGF